MPVKNGEPTTEAVGPNIQFPNPSDPNMEMEEPEMSEDTARTILRNEKTETLQLTAESAGLNPRPTKEERIASRARSLSARHISLDFAQAPKKDNSGSTFRSNHFEIWSCKNRKFSAGKCQKI
jgi:hypothetical protein